MNDIIQKMKSELNKGVVTASVTSSTMIEVTKLNTFISGLKTSRNETLQQLGAFVYEVERKIRQDDSEAKKALISKLIDTDQKIQEREEQIEKLKNDKAEILSGIGRSTSQAVSIAASTPTHIASQVRCAACGAALKVNGKFCGGCGSSMNIAMPPQSEPYQDKEIRFCGCGEELRFDALFCGKCGMTVPNPIPEEEELLVRENYKTDQEIADSALATQRQGDHAGSGAIETTPPVRTNVCKDCGNDLKSQARFCGRCGMPQEA